MEEFLVSTASVAVGELGDKTQLLSLILASRLRRPVPIIAGVFVATLGNHLLACWFGEWVGNLITPQILRWVLGLSFIAVAIWALIPDKMDDDLDARSAHGVFVFTVVTFFLAEMGDKTQIATAVIAAEYHPLWQVIAGTTIGMLVADVPVVWLGATFAQRLPLRGIRYATALLFAALGAWILLR